MAKITAGPLAGVVSGKLGCVVFSRGRYGPYLRTRVLPTRVSTEATRDVRGRLSSLSKAWASLDGAEQLAWKTWAETHPIVDRLGNSRVLSGSAAFIQLNARILQASGTQIDVPPTVASPAPILTLSLVVDVGVGDEATLDWTSGQTGAMECVAVWMAVVDSLGREYYRNLMKLVAVTAGAQATGIDLQAAIESRFGTSLLGQRVFVEAEVWDNATGLVSSRSACSTIVISST